jgi:hypothetical protein
MQSMHAIRTIFGVFLDGLTLIRLCFRPTAVVAAKNLFLLKQLGLYVERNVKPPRATKRHVRSYRSGRSKEELRSPSFGAASRRIP